jgi:hypothetical protein
MSLKSLGRLIGAGVMVATLGLFVGATVAPDVVQADIPACEQDECEAGLVCVDNNGQNTGCAKTGNTCKTYGC